MKEVGRLSHQFGKNIIVGFLKEIPNVSVCVCVQVLIRMRH